MVLRQQTWCYKRKADPPPAATDDKDQKRAVSLISEAGPSLREDDKVRGVLPEGRNWCWGQGWGWASVVEEMNSGEIGLDGGVVGESDGASSTVGAGGSVVSTEAAVSVAAVG